MAWEPPEVKKKKAKASDNGFIPPEVKKKKDQSTSEGTTSELAGGGSEPSKLDQSQSGYDPSKDPFSKNFDKYTAPENQIEPIPQPPLQSDQKKLSPDEGVQVMIDKFFELQNRRKAASEAYQAGAITADQAEEELQLVSSENKAASEELQRQLARKGPPEEYTGFDAWNALVDNPEKIVPFISSAKETEKMYDILQAAQRLDDGIESDKDLLMLKEFMDMASTDKTFWGSVVDGLSEIPAFAGELVLTGGVYSGAKKATMKGAQKAIKKLMKEGGEELLKKKLSQFSLKVAGGIAGATAQTIPASVTRIPGNVAERMVEPLVMGTTFSKDEEGKIITLLDDDADVGKLEEAIPKALGDSWIEVLSERSGGLFTSLSKPARNWVVKHAITRGLIKANPSKSPSKIIDFVRKAGYHGVLEEMGEERLGEIGRYAIGVTDEYHLPTKEQLRQELTIFSIPGATISVLNVATQKLNEFREKSGRVKDLKENPPSEDQLEKQESLYSIGDVEYSKDEFMEAMNNDGVKKDIKDNGLKVTVVNDSEAESVVKKAFPEKSPIEKIKTKEEIQKEQASGKETTGKAQKNKPESQTNVKKESQSKQPEVVSKGLEQALQKKHPNLTIDVFENEKNNDITLSRVVVPESERGQGIGSDFMNDLISEADKKGARILLTPSDDFGATSVKRLKDFYKGFGFVENKGQNKDFSTKESMYRNPSTQQVSDNQLINKQQQNEQEKGKTKEAEVLSGVQLKLSPEVQDAYNQDKSNTALNGGAPTILVSGIDKIKSKAGEAGFSEVDLSGLTAKEIIDKRGSIDFLGEPPLNKTKKELAKDKFATAAQDFMSAIGGIQNVSGESRKSASDAVIRMAEAAIEAGAATVEEIIDHIKSRLKDLGHKNIDIVDRYRKEIEDYANQKAAKKGDGSNQKKQGAKTRKKRYEARGLDHYAGNAEIEEAISRNGLDREVVPWRAVDPIATEIVSDALKDPNKIDSNLEGILNSIRKTTNEQYADNERLSTLHAQTFHKVLDYFYNTGNYEKFSEWNKWFSNLGADRGRFISAMQNAASPEAIKNRAIASVVEGRSEKLGKSSTDIDGLTAKEEIEKVRKELAITKAEFDERLKDKVDEAIKKIRNEVRDEFRRKQKEKVEYVKPTGDRIRDARNLRKEALKQIRNGIRQSRGQASAGIPLNEDLILGVTNLIRSYVMEGLYRIDDIRRRLFKDVGSEDKATAKSVDDNFNDIYSRVAKTLEDQRKENQKSALIDRISNEAKRALADSKSEAKSPEDVLARTLIAKVKEDIKRDKAKRPRKEYIDEIREGMLNAEFSDGVWTSAMENIKQWLYTQNFTSEQESSIISQMEDSMSNFMDKPFAGSHLRSQIRNEMKDIGEEVSKVVREHYTVQNNVTKTIAQAIIEKTGVSPVVAKRYSDAIVGEVSQYMQDAKLAEIRRMYNLDKNFEKKDKKAKVNRRIIDQIMANINLGALDSELFTGYFAEKYNFANLTPEHIKQLKRFNDLINKHQGSEMSRRYVKEMSDYIENLKHWDAKKVAETFQSMVIRAALTGLRTNIVNIPVGSFSSYLSTTAPFIIGNPSAYRAFRKAWKDSGMRSIGRKSFLDIMRTNYNILDEGGSKFDERRDSHGDMIDYWINTRNKDYFIKAWKSADTPKKQFSVFTKGFAHMYLKLYQISNFAKAFDAIINHRGAEMKQFMDEFNEQRKISGVSGMTALLDTKVADEISEKVKEKMGYDTESRADIDAQVESEIDNMRASGERVPTGYQERRRKELMEDLREREKVQDALEWVKRATLMEAPTGMLGRGYEMFVEKTALRDNEDVFGAMIKTGAKVTLGLFLRISITSSQRAMESIPGIGLAMPGIFYDYKKRKGPRGENLGWKFDWNDPKTRNHRLMIHAAALTLMAGAAAVMFKRDDDEDKLVLDPDRWIDITGAGAGKFDTETLTSLNDDGTVRHRENFMISVKTNGKWHNILPARLVPQLLPAIALLGSVRDETLLEDPKVLNDRELMDLVWSRTDDIGLALMEQSFATIPQLASRMVRSIESGGTKGGIQTTAQFMASPFRTAIYPNINRDIWNEYKAIKGGAIKTGDPLNRFFGKDVAMAEDMLLTSVTDIFGYEVKRTSKIISAIQESPEIGVIVDNFVDFKNINQERFGEKAWNLKNKYRPNIVIKRYWPTDKVAANRELKQLANRKFGERMRELWTSQYTEGKNKGRYIIEATKGMSDVDFEENILKAWNENAREYAKEQVSIEREKSKQNQ